MKTSKMLLEKRSGLRLLTDRKKKIVYENKKQMLLVAAFRRRQTVGLEG